MAHDVNSFWLNVFAYNFITLNSSIVSYRITRSCYIVASVWLSVVCL